MSRSTLASSTIVRASSPSTRRLPCAANPRGSRRGADDPSPAAGPRWSRSHRVPRIHQSEAAAREIPHIAGRELGAGDTGCRCDLRIEGLDGPAFTSARGDSMSSAPPSGAKRRRIASARFGSGWSRSPATASLRIDRASASIDRPCRAARTRNRSLTPNRHCGSSASPLRPFLISC